MADQWSGFRQLVAGNPQPGFGRCCQAHVLAQVNGVGDSGLISFQGESKATNARVEPIDHYTMFMIVFLLELYYLIEYQYCIYCRRCRRNYEV